jgi:hypothetical protein
VGRESLVFAFVPIPADSASASETSESLTATGWAVDEVCALLKRSTSRLVDMSGLHGRPVLLLRGRVIGSSHLMGGGAHPAPFGSAM